MHSPIIQQLIQTIGQENVQLGQAVADSYSHIWKMEEPLIAKAILLPRSTNDVAAIMKLCHENQQPIVIHGGRTNLVGSTETGQEEIVISFEKMKQIIEVDEKSRTMTVEAGVILEEIHQAAEKKDLLFPMSFGAKGSAQIGGVIATNAGGLKVFRYGMTRQLILGLEVVMADGTIISSMKKIIKDNSAYDLKQLFIGSEGTLGLITKAVLKLSEAPSSRTSAFVAFDDYDKVVGFLKFMDKGLAGTLSSYELIWGRTYKSMTSPPALAKPPLPHGFQYYVLLEGLGSHPQEDQALFQRLMETAFEQELILDAAIANSDADLDWFWKIREDVHVIVSQCTFDQHFDISLPIALIGEHIDKTIPQLEAINGVEKVFPFGHLGDGNVHFIIGKVDESKALKNQINDVVYAGLQNIGGSMSAEHGIGLHKKSYLQLCRTREEIELMKLLKRTLDPFNLLNRGKVLDV